MPTVGSNRMVYSSSLRSVYGVKSIGEHAAASEKGSFKLNLFERRCHVICICVCPLGYILSERTSQLICWKNFRIRLVQFGTSVI